MDVILLQDVKALGKKGQVVKASDGYARNFLFPKKLGVEATPKNLNDLKLHLTSIRRRLHCPSQSRTRALYMQRSSFTRRLRRSLRFA